MTPPRTTNARGGGLYPDLMGGPVTTAEATNGLRQASHVRGCPRFDTAVPSRSCDTDICMSLRVRPYETRRRGNATTPSDPQGPQTSHDVGEREPEGRDVGVRARPAD